MIKNPADELTNLDLDTRRRKVAVPAVGGGTRGNAVAKATVARGTATDA